MKGSVPGVIIIWEVEMKKAPTYFWADIIAVTIVMITIVIAIALL